MPRTVVEDITQKVSRFSSKENGKIASVSRCEVATPQDLHYKVDLNAFEQYKTAMSEKLSDIKELMAQFPSMETVTAMEKDIAMLKQVLTDGEWVKEGMAALKEQHDSFMLEFEANARKEHETLRSEIETFQSLRENPVIEESFHSLSAKLDDLLAKMRSAQDALDEIRQIREEVSGKAQPLPVPYKEFEKKLQSTQQLAESINKSNKKHEDRLNVQRFIIIVLLALLGGMFFLL